MNRLPIPEKDEDFMAAFVNGVEAYNRIPERVGGAYVFGVKVKMGYTCGHCQLICHPDKEERKRRYKMLTRAGVIMQRPDGSYEAVPPEEAEARLAAMPSEQRALYEKV